jgi:hypothetical protein
MRELSNSMQVIPPTQLVVASYSTYETESNPRFNPTNEVGGWFILRLAIDLFHFAMEWPSERLNMNNPPTALVGFGTVGSRSCRPNMNDPPTALVGLKINGRVFGSSPAL